MVLTTFIHLQKIHNFSKFGGHDSKFELAIPLSSSNLKQAWQAHFLSNTLKILKNCVFLIDKQMILLLFFDTSNHMYNMYNDLEFPPSSKMMFEKKYDLTN